MILVDANILLYAHVVDYPQHERARQWLDTALNGVNRVGLPWESLLAFVRLVTNPKLFPRPESPADAWHQVSEWLDADPSWTPIPTDRHREVLESLVPSVTRSTLVPDAHLAALAIEHGLTLVSTDGDFARFPGLRWENPLGG
ncbi:type II toxin-antitoxin system VapC family toxin [Jiangella rhizosphaerae]|uniref:Ribonuclease VapC n=1 Tax=Jiangella rhizosphaerae TaxID=2293569 RepID=A0A418KWG0_9ACTN|nr:type II toxin-antitoxin system VapC family toxin [Jiangella rhizosphaerae]RIQ34860.1 type II toxin-antitoxin system VapC family toxin [Jiangella rhizosphaerae]